MRRLWAGHRCMHAVERNMAPSWSGCIGAISLLTSCMHVLFAACQRVWPVRAHASFSLAVAHDSKTAHPLLKNDAQDVFVYFVWGADVWSAHGETAFRISKGRIAIYNENEFRRFITLEESAHGS